MTIESRLFLFSFRLTWDGCTSCCSLTRFHRMFVCIIRQCFLASFRFFQELQARRSGDRFILFNDNKVYEELRENTTRQREGCRRTHEDTCR
jgi:hypothetical protein